MSNDKVEILEVPSVASSPLLQEPVIERAYSKKIGVSADDVTDGSTPESGVDGTPPPAAEETNYNDIADAAEKGSVPPIEISSESHTEPDGDGEGETGGDPEVGGQGVEVPDSIAKTKARSTANFFLDMYASIIPELFHNISSIDESDINIREKKGEVLPGSTEVVKETNLNNREHLNMSDDQKKMIRKP